MRKAVEKSMSRDSITLKTSHTQKKPAPETVPWETIRIDRREKSNTRK